MSQYEYYEFQAVDHRLSEADMQALRTCSSRAVITSSSFTNEYHFGSFKGNAEAWMEKYFDGYLYNSHWGTRILMLGLPAQVLPLASVIPYCGSDALSAQEKVGKVILEFLWHDEDYEHWVQHHQELSDLLPLRDQLAQGDLRSLYLGWLLGVQSGAFADGELEPPVPVNLGESSGVLRDLAEFLRIDQDLLAAAAATSPSHKAASGGREIIVGWLASLSTVEKDAWLLRVLEGASNQIAMEMKARFSRDQLPQPAGSTFPRRTVGQLLSRARARRKEREKAEAHTALVRKQQAEQEAAKARRIHLDGLVGRESELWRQIDEVIATRQPKNYDLAVQNLLDLRELTVIGKSGESEFQAHLDTLLTVHAAKTSLMDRLRRTGLA